MRISVIFTGGTIGSLTGSEWVGIDKATNFMLLDRFKDRYSDIKFDTFTPYSILSENLAAEQINKLQNAVKQALDTRPDGVIITHGTDTLQYAAAAIEYAFADAKIPLVFVSADYPLDNEKTNGYINFEAAVEFIKKEISGTYIAYKNEGEAAAHIHLASRVLSFHENSADIVSLGGVAAEYEGGNLCVKSIEKNESPAPLGIVDYSENSGILTVESRPGDNYNYSLDAVKAVILKPYHSGTLNTDSENLSAFCKKAEKKGIPVFVSGVKSGIGYESSKLFSALNICVPKYSTYISLYMKLWAAVSRDEALEMAANSVIACEIAE